MMLNEPYLTDNESAFWSEQSAINFYRAQRCTKEHLYKSEQLYINDALFKLGSHIDVGCAAGGLAAVAIESNPSISFTGIDISSAMIEAAREKFPMFQFCVSDGELVDAKDNAYATSSCLGVLHLTKKWKDLLAEMWRVTSSVMVFDTRLVETGTRIGLSYQTLAYTGSPSKAAIPYTAITPLELFQAMLSLSPSPLRVEIKGHMHPPSTAACVPVEELCMAMCCLWKMPVALRGEKFESGIYINMPIA